MSCQKLVRCWNCKHLKTLYQGEPKEGRLFADAFKRCDIHGKVLRAHYEIVMERLCSDHIRVGLWEKPLNFSLCARIMRAYCDELKQRK